MKRIAVMGAGVLAVAVVGVAAWRLLAGDSAEETQLTTAADPNEAVAEFNPANNPRAAVAQIHAAALDDPDGLRDVGLEHAHSSDAEVRWAALYALSLVVEPGDEESAEALRVALQSADLDERLAAAGGLVASGERSALPVLIELLGSGETTSYVRIPAWRVARGLLLTSTSEDFGLRAADSAAAAASTAPAWESWWRDAGANLTWQPAEGRFQ